MTFYNKDGKCFTSAQLSKEHYKTLMLDWIASQTKYTVENLKEVSYCDLTKEEQKSWCIYFEKHFAIAEKEFYDSSN